MGTKETKITEPTLILKPKMYRPRFIKNRTYGWVSTLARQEGTPAGQNLLEYVLENPATSIAKRLRDERIHFFMGGMTTEPREVAPYIVWDEKEQNFTRSAMSARWPWAFTRLKGQRATVVMVEPLLNRKRGS